jgi:hypothetical protein
MRVTVVAALLPPLVAACVSVTGVLREPVSTGQLARYAVPADSLAAAATRVLGSDGFRVAADTTVDSTRLLLGARGVTLDSWGELDRVAITPAAPAEVRIISRSARRLDLFHTNRTPRLFQALDGELGGVGIGPFPGDRVRLARVGGRWRTGTARSAADSAGTLTLEIGGRAETAAPGDPWRLAISRGRYGHAKEGGLLGTFVGGLVGFVAAGPTSGDFGVAQRTAGFLIGSVVGAFVGGGVGASIQTEVWSDVAPVRARSHPPR